MLSLMLWPYSHWDNCYLPLQIPPFFQRGLSRQKSSLCNTTSMSLLLFPQVLWFSIGNMVYAFSFSSRLHSVIPAGVVQCHMQSAKRSFVNTTLNILQVLRISYVSWSKHTLFNVKSESPQAQEGEKKTPKTQPWDQCGFYQSTENRSFLRSEWHLSEQTPPCTIQGPGTKPCFKIQGDGKLTSPLLQPHF